MRIRRIGISLAAALICLSAALSPASAAKKTEQKKILKPAEAAERVVTLTKKYFSRGRKVTLSGAVVEENGLYKVKCGVAGATKTFYITKDGGSLILPGGMIDIARYEDMLLKKEEAENAPLPRAEKPTVELFVMSLCPYGTKAMRTILPLVKEFGETIDFRIRFIVTVKGDTIGTVHSLHGEEEVREDCRQAAIMRYYPGLLAAYLDYLKKSMCLLSCGEMKLEDHWKKSAGELKMETKKIEDFVSGGEAFLLLQQDAADAQKKDVKASPTLLINGVQSSSIRQGKKGLRQALCSAFSEMPAVCRDTLLEQPPAKNQFTVIDAKQ